MNSKGIISLEDQLSRLEAAGIELNQGITSDILLEHFFEREYYERKPYLRLLISMGTTLYTEANRSFELCKQIWYLNKECIYEKGDYVRIVERMRNLTNGVLPIHHIRDHIDWGEEEAWVMFRFENEIVHWPLEVDDEWMDQTILKNFTELLASKHTQLKYFVLQLKRNDLLIGCCDETQLDELKQLTGLPFQWLQNEWS